MEIKQQPAAGAAGSMEYDMNFEKATGALSLTFRRKAAGKTYIADQYYKIPMQIMPPHYQDDDGTAYFISSSNENADTHVYRLSDDFLSAESLVARLFVGEFREAPVLFKRKGRYYIFNSYCSGWDPNQCKYSTSMAIDGEWEPLCDCADDTTFHTQPAFLLQVTGTDGELFLYMGDRWSGSEYFSSSYVMLPLEFSGETEMNFSYVDEFSVDVQAGNYIVR